MNKELMAALVDLNSNNTGVGTLFELIGSRVYIGLSPQQPVYPNIILSSVGGTLLETFKNASQIREPRVAFTIWSKSRGTSQMYDIIKRTMALYDGVLALAISGGVVGTIKRESEPLVIPLTDLPGWQGTLNYRIFYSV